MIRLTFTIALMLLTIAVQAQHGQSPKLEEVADFGSYQPIGVAVSQKPAIPPRIFITFPKTAGPYQYGLAEIVHGKRQPYPNTEWNRWDSLKPQDHFINVQALLVDDQNSLWVLDPANAGDAPAIVAGIKLLKINLSTNQVERIYRFEDLPRERTALNDVRVDTRRQIAYLSDPGRATIVVLDLKSGKSRNLLQQDASTKADPAFVLKIDGRAVRDKSGNPFRSNVNGIALTADGRYLYYRPITQTKLFRIDTKYLIDSLLSPAEVASHVETMGETGVSHGMIADGTGNVYLTDSPGKAIRRFTPADRLEMLVHDDRLLWPDSFAVGPDGYLYVTAAQIHRTKKYNDGQDKVEYPFRLYRIKL